MEEDRLTCFVIMPFLEELHYFYLYMKHHIESTHKVICLRGDSDILTVPVLDKIRQYIGEANVLIADCSGRNPNVYYELGIAHEMGKKVILITKDPVKDAPTDIRHMEFIPYELGRHVEFFTKLDGALKRVFDDRYESLYLAAVALFHEFREQTKTKVEIATKELFVQRILAIPKVQSIPSPPDTKAVTPFVLPRIISDSNDYEVMASVMAWIANRLSV